MARTYLGPGGISPPPPAHKPAAPSAAPARATAPSPSFLDSFQSVLSAMAGNALPAHLTHGMQMLTLTGSQQADIAARKAVSPRFSPDLTHPGTPVLFFNDHETLWPGQLGNTFRDISRDPARPLVPPAQTFSIRGSHSSANFDSAATLGIRWTNTSSAPIKLGLNAVEVAATFGPLGANGVINSDSPLRDGQGKTVPGATLSRSQDGWTLTLPPSSQVDLPVMSLAKKPLFLSARSLWHWASFALTAQVLEGQASSLQVREVARFDSAASKTGVDPWTTGKPVADVSALKRHQEGVFTHATADIRAPVVLTADNRLSVAGYNFGTAPDAANPAQLEHGFAYHVDHTVYVAIEGNPTLQLRGNGGFANPLINGQKWLSPGLRPDVVLQMPLSRAIGTLLQKVVAPDGTQRRDAQGRPVYRMDVSFQDNDNMNLELSIAR